ncbi:hypothetical protein ACK1LH_11830 [Metabacillus indicus]|uniref:hypothetical protein n=1 Tax=Metabacillus TaxID=2675233 RepID=UPI00193A4FBC|nr:hypothetical protein [Metabacillus sp. cB07]
MKKMIAKTVTFLSVGILTAGFAGESASAKQLNASTTPNRESVSIQAVEDPGGGGYTWTYVTTKYHSAGYYKVYEDFDAVWHYIKNVYYDKNGKYLETKYLKYYR